MLDDISNRSVIKILAQQPAATPEQIQELNEYFAQCPPEYIDLAFEATEIEMQYSEGQYLRIWGPLGCIEMDEGYGIRQSIPSAFPIGDDGGGHVIFFCRGKTWTWSLPCWLWKFRPRRCDLDCSRLALILGRL